MNRWFVKHQKSIYLLLALIVCGIIGYLYCCSKRSFNIDESLSYALANEPKIGWISYDPKGWLNRTFFSGFAVNENPFNYSQVFYNQAQDVHPPLFYLLIHTISSLNIGKLSIWYVLGINYCSYLVNIGLIYFLAHKYSKNPLFSFFIALLYGLNFRVLEGMLFLRMYQLLSTFILLFFIIGMQIIDSKSESDDNKAYYILLFLITILGGLTHYFFYFAIGFLSLLFTFALLRKKQVKKLLWSTGTVVVAVLLNIFLIFPGTISQVFSNNGNAGHGEFVLSQLENPSISLERLTYFINNTWGNEFSFYFSLCLIVIAIILLVRKKNNKYLYTVTPLSAYCLNLLLVSQTATYINWRYSLPMEGIGIIGFSIGIYQLCGLFKKKIRQIISIVCVIIITLFNCNFSIISQNFGTPTSWEFAKENSDKICLIVVDENIDCFRINEQFLDLYEYSAVGITSKNNPLLNAIHTDFVVYIENSLNQDEAIIHVEDIMPEGVCVDLVPQPQIQTVDFNVYLAKITGDTYETE